MKKTLFLILTILFCPQNLRSEEMKKDIPSLCEVYKNYFPVGAAVNLKTIISHADLLKKHFNSITPENHLKWGLIHPLPDKYNFEDANKIINFAIENKMKIRGHTLVWHIQVPDWVFKDEKGNWIDKETLLNRLHQHIENVVGYYKGKIYAWDVVNEAISDKEGEFLRDVPWYRIGGEGVIEKAFIWTHEIDPDAVLFYNDYNLELPSKREKAYTLIKKLKEKGVPIGGIGIQAHWGLKGITPEDLEESIKKFSSLGIQVQITEFDISIYLDNNEKFNSIEEVPEERIQKQLELYKKAFEVLRRNKELITGVTFWGVADDVTWLDNFPVKGRKNFPLLFDIHHKPKRIFWEIINF
jgi:endo-1,4-beta-xylanase